MISIIIPFNNIKYLKNCLEKLDCNKNNFCEVVLINDCDENCDENCDKNCDEDYDKDNAKKYLKNFVEDKDKEYTKDDAKKIVEEYEKMLKTKYYKIKKEDDLKMPIIKYYRVTEKTIGVGNARNIGIEKASGEYIMFLDADDALDNNLLSNLQEYIEEDIEMIKYKMKIVRNNKEFLSGGISFNITDGEDGFNKLCFKDSYLDSPCLYLIKKELFTRTNLKFEKNVYHEDFGLIPQLIINAKSIVSLNYYGYNYYQTENSIMRNNDYLKETKKVDDKFFLYNKLLENLSKFNITEKTKHNLLEYYTNSIILAIKHLKKEDRKKYEDKIKKEKLLDNLKPKNVKQFGKKILLKANMDLYYRFLEK